MKKYIDIHTHQKENRENIFSLHNINPEDFIQLPDNRESYFSTGIHPWHINEKVEESINILKKIAFNPHIIAIGETGLDKLCSVNFELQKEIFICQIDIAKEAGKPLVIHCVKAWNEIQQILKEMRFNMPVIFHGFRGKPQLAADLLKTGYYLSFGKLFNRESLQITPLDRLFLETDDNDFLIEEIYHPVADIKGIAEKELINACWKNFGECFEKGDF